MKFCTKCLWTGKRGLEISQGRSVVCVGFGGGLWIRIGTRTIFGDAPK